MIARAAPADALDRWIFGLLPARPRSLGVYRVLVGGYFVLYVAPVVTLPAFPSSFYAPPLGPFRLLPALPPTWCFVLLSVALGVASLALLIGYHTRVASIATGLLGFVGFGFVYSFGKIDHNFILVMVAPLVMAASGWGNELSVDRLRGRRPQQVQAWPLSLFALLLGFMMFSAGLSKLATGWLNPATHAAQGQFVINYLSGRQDFLAPYFLHMQNGALWELLDYVTVVFELGFLFAIASRAWLRMFCVVAVLFHVAVLLMLNIDFSPNLVAYAAFVNWAPRLRQPMPETQARWRRTARQGIARGPWVALFTVAAGAGVGAATFAARVPLLQLSLSPLHLGPLLPSLLLYVPASVIAVGYLAQVGQRTVCGGGREMSRRPAS